MMSHKVKSALHILGSPDDLKFRSCLTLFSQAASDDADRVLFKQAIWINSLAARRTGERWSCYAQLRPEMLPRKCEQEGDKTMTISSGPSGTMYGFLACTASQYMTPTVITVERQTTIGPARSVI